MSDVFPYETRRLVANGLAHRVLAWRATGGVARRVVVLLHGFMDAATSWDDVAPTLARAGFDVFAPDLRGFGETERVGAGGYYYFYDYIADVADLVEALSPHTPIALVGHSMGGTVAGLYSGVFPARVSRLALLEGLGPPPSDEALAPTRARGWIEGVRRLRARAERAMTLDEATSRLAATHPYVDPAIVARRAAQLTRASADEPGKVQWRFDPLHRTTSPVGFSLERWRAHAAEITAATLTIGGGVTGFHPADEAERIAAIAGARRVEIEDAGHMMHWTRAREVGGLLVEALA